MLRIALLFHISIACLASDECQFSDGVGLLSRGFCHYLGIPYAQPPIGVRKHRAPEAKDLQQDNGKEWNFTQRPPNCLQYDFQEQTMAGSEDCLYLNVFTKPGNKRLDPVLVWIHGGTFNFGSGFSDLAEFPDLFVAQNITVVTFNYRLGALGFLYREGGNVSRNAGLKDQQEVLRWVQRNIASFGGDPSKVTLMGWSAGSAAVSYHLFDPAAEGLFSAAIMMSGSFLNPWAHSPSPELCLSITCRNMEIPCADTLPDIVINDGLAYFTLFGMFYPCFVPSGKLPQLVIKTKPAIDVPLLIGFTARETEAHVKYHHENTPSNYILPHPDHLAVIEEFVTQKLPESNFTEFLIASDLIHGVVKFAEEYAKRTKSKTFLYKFSLSHGRHGDDLPFIFRTDNTTQLLQLWANFITFRDPTPFPEPHLNATWKPFGSRNGRSLMNIGRQLTMEHFKESTSFILWDGIYECLYYGNCTNVPN
ncbi:venom carboxylesterase-6-like [Phlebotomus argentipes]|uniref:venom carboxylesterase-6-like n=1 Tax=Phlebotomus argentipes TaxID=94469 RepID=UPI002892DA6D|nr:venom carboxylesterase-6-like [Phlebotomus argentipes]